MARTNAKRPARLSAAACGSELNGVGGSIDTRIEGKQHFYDLDYSLPTR